jgi:hypothetical protein
MNDRESRTYQKFQRVRDFGPAVLAEGTSASHGERAPRRAKAGEPPRTPSASRVLLFSAQR